MRKQNEIKVKDVLLRTLRVDNEDYISITDIAKQKIPLSQKMW
jgi:hypothetical protein